MKKVKKLILFRLVKKLCIELIAKGIGMCRGIADKASSEYVKVAKLIEAYR